MSESFAMLRVLIGKRSPLTAAEGGIMVMMVNAALCFILVLSQPASVHRLAYAGSEEVSAKISHPAIENADLDRMIRPDFMGFAGFGAICGALIKVVMYPPKNRKRRKTDNPEDEIEVYDLQQMALEYLVAMLAGISFTPLAMVWAPIMPVHPVSAMPVSCLLAITSTLIVHGAFWYVKQRADKYLGDKPE